MTRAPTIHEGPTAGATGPDAFLGLVARLSRQSVEKHFDAYADVGWDDPAMRIDPRDPRWELEDFDPLARTAWYRALPAEEQALLGLHRVAVTMRTGWEFENVLQRGLLSYAFWLGNGRPEFRYLHHEVAEESQHTMMFQEFVNRTGLPVRGLGRVVKLAAELFVIPLARLSPALFFFFVLGGEDPIDVVQRRRLRAGVKHPLLERIIRIHVTEEARHTSFARHFLAREVPRLPAARRFTLSLAVPLLLGTMVRLMLAPPRAFVRARGVPRDVARAAARSADHAELRADAVARIRRLCRETGLMNPLARALWRAAGIWADEPAGPAATARAA